MISSKPTILVAEDDKDDQELLLYAFNQITDQHHLTMVENGRELITLLNQLKDFELPCLIVLDYNMPDLNGKQTLEILQSEYRYQTIPKIIYTTSNSKTERLACLSIGASDYMIKPSDLEEIISSAKQMLTYCQVRS